MLKLAKKWAKAKKHPKAKNYKKYSLSSFTLLSKNSGRHSKKCTKIRYACFNNDVIWLMTMKMRLKTKNRSQRYDINWSRPRHVHRYTKYKIWCLSIMVVICIKLGRFETLSWVEKSVAQKRNVVEWADHLSTKSCGSPFRFNEVECPTMMTVNF